MDCPSHTVFSPLTPPPPLKCACISRLGLPDKVPARGLRHRGLLSGSSGGWKAKVKGSAGSVSPEAHTWAYRGPPFCCVLTHGLFSELLVSPPLLIRTPALLAQGPTRITPFNSVTSDLLRPHLQIRLHRGLGFYM